MKHSAAVVPERKRNSFSIDSIIAGSRRSAADSGSPASPDVDTRADPPPSTQLPPLPRHHQHPRSVPTTTGVRLPDPSLPGAHRTAYDEREVMRRHQQQRSLFDGYGSRYDPGYDQALAAQFAAAAAAAMATMTSSVDASGRAAAAAATDPLSYAYWMHANRHHPAPALFMPGKQC